ncbi:sensor histidine kinase [Natrononativus amylolyticus]|uniref:sensor histidine kinase n=1 Tax=Natrononativus amylolyticus TaxID=2963434 RepID=UPI0020CE7F72|nr:HAMP domain-containing sensor histidine kinase [Natrononativus amylolyticus]
MAVSPEFYGRIGDWCLLGSGSMTGLVLLIELTVGLTNVGTTVLILSAVASAAGFWVGLYDAQGKTRATETARRNRDLERQNKQLESVARMLAHELRNPLAIAQVYFGQSYPENETAAAEVRRAHDRLEEMIDILLVTVRSSEVSLSSETISLGEQADSVWRECTPTKDAATLVIDTDRLIVGDTVHIRRLLANLFQNSLEHAATDGDLVVRIGPLEDGFFVEDNGSGIPEADRDRVTEAGYTTKPDGTGLGLTYVPHLAELYEWDVSITSSDDGGMRFEFTGTGLETVAEAHSEGIGP